MTISTRHLPLLRPVEAIPDEANGSVILRDPTRLAAGALVVGQAELFLLALMDGTKSWLEIQSEYARRTGRLLLSPELEALLDQLDGAGFLEGEGFDRYYQGLLDEYRGAPYRPLREPDSYGVPAAELPSYLDNALLEARLEVRPAPRRPAGLVAPHLDFPRGLRSYAASYAHLFDRPAGPLRVVVLGTNHFGRSRSVVATDRDFETHWGVVPTDREFLARLEADCGGSLRPYELDHLHEHSIELHAIWLHHLLGEQVQIVPFLCPDPSGPRGTQAGDPGGVDLRDFALALGEQVRRDPTPTLLVASADLSHVGRYFEEGDPDLDEGFLSVVREFDESGLQWIDRNDPEGYRVHMARTQNPTRVCSVGCLYALMVALGPNAEPRRLRYDQLVTREIENCVTCAAYSFS